jgi:hypothetical protein
MKPAFVIVSSIVITFISILKLEGVIDFIGVGEGADPAHLVGSLSLLVIILPLNC